MPRATAPFPWPGSKGGLADWILEVLPRHDTFIDLFGGAGSVLFEKPPSDVEIYNDADPDLVQFMTILKTRPDELVERLQMVPYARDLHEEWASAFFQGYRPDDPVERAARYYFIRRSQYGGEAATKAGFRATVSGRRNPARQWSNSITRLYEFSDQLQSVEISGQDYATLLGELSYQSETCVIYCDPPYRDSVDRYQLQSESSQAVAVSKPSFDFDTFVETIAELAGEPDAPYIVISTDVIPSDFENFHRVSQSSSHSMNAEGGAKQTTEHLVTNFNPETTPEHSSNRSLSAFCPE